MSAPQSGVAQEFFILFGSLLGSTIDSHSAHRLTDDVLLKNFDESSEPMPDQTSSAATNLSPILIGQPYATPTILIGPLGSPLGEHAGSGGGVLAASDTKSPAPDTANAQTMAWPTLAILKLRIVPGNPTLPVGPNPIPEELAMDPLPAPAPTRMVPPQPLPLAGQLTPLAQPMLTQTVAPQPVFTTTPAIVPSPAEATAPTELAVVPSPPAPSNTATSIQTPTVAPPPVHAIIETPQLNRLVSDQRVSTGEASPKEMAANLSAPARSEAARAIQGIEGRSDTASSHDQPQAEREFVPKEGSSEFDKAVSVALGHDSPGARDKSKIPGAKASTASLPDPPSRVVDQVADKSGLAANRPLRELSLRIAGANDSKVDVHVSDRAGQIRVDVRGTNPGLAAEIQTHADDLVGSLREKGYQAEVSRPVESSVLLSTHEAAGKGSGRDHSPESGRDGSGAWQQQQQEEPQHRRRSRQAWIDFFEENNAGQAAPAKRES